jgi:hypothetical protein
LHISVAVCGASSNKPDGSISFSLQNAIPSFRLARAVGDHVRRRHRLPAGEPIEDTVVAVREMEFLTALRQIGMVLQAGRIVRDELTSTASRESFDHAE